MPDFYSGATNHLGCFIEGFSLRRVHGRLMLTVLGGLAEFERDLIRARMGEGRARAKARGVHIWGDRRK